MKLIKDKMNFTFASTLEEIEQSKSFKNFKKQNPEAYLCAGFFVIDFLTEKNQKQLDYSLPNGKIFTFIINSETSEIQMTEAKTIEGKTQKLEKLNTEKIKTDLDDVEQILKEESKKHNLNKKINKIIAILQQHEGKQIWNLNCMLEGMEILQVWIDCFSVEILKFEKKNLFDFVKKQ